MVIISQPEQRYGSGPPDPPPLFFKKHFKDLFWLIRMSFLSAVYLKNGDYFPTESMKIVSKAYLKVLNNLRRGAHLGKRQGAPQGAKYLVAL